MEIEESSSPAVDPKMPLLAIIGWLFCLIGLAYATLVGNGSEFPRLTYSLPFLVVGSLLLLLRGTPEIKGWLLFLVFVGGGYFLLRAINSPVWDLARRDVVLITGAISALVAGACSFQYKFGRGLFLGVLLCLLLANGVVAAYQGLVDPSYAVFDFSRADQKGVSGFYYHRNYLAGFLEISAPVFVALASRGGRGWLIWTLAALGTVTLCFFTNSRGGFIVLILGSLCTFASLKFFSAEALGKKFHPWAVTSSVVLVVVVIVAGWFSFEVLASKREGIEGSTIGRLGLAGIAFDVWMQSPVVGQGSYAYSYLFPKNFAGLGGWYGDAKMVHSDYLQLLAEYGAVGLIVAVVLIVVFLGCAWLSCRDTLSNPHNWLPFSALGTLVAEVVRAAFDFNLHMVPNLVLFAMLIGGISSTGQFSPASPTSPRQLSPRLAKAGFFVLLFLVGATGLTAIHREVAAVPLWLKVERAKSRGEDVLPSLHKYSLAAPSYHALRQVGRALIERGDAESMEQAAEIWRIAVELHPFDGEGLANYAYCLDQLGEFSRAEVYHLRAVEAVARRENRYGVVYGVGWHLVRRAESASQQRRSGEALFLFLAARAAFQESYKLNFSRTVLNAEAQHWLNKRIDFLEGARIEPVEVEILDWRSKLP